METFVRRFMTEFDIPAFSLAVAKDEQLKIAVAYGYSDVKRGTLATPENLFRIASNSKVVTAAAIFKLVEMGRLRLEDRLFGPDAVLGRSSSRSHEHTYVRQPGLSPP